MKALAASCLFLLFCIQNFGQNSTFPPNTPVRGMAEWEELDALLVSWRSDPSLLTEIIRAARLECKVVVCCNSTSTLNTAQNTLLSAGVDLSSNVELVVIPNNTIWIRDYGPQCVYSNGVDSLMLINWIYNRSGRENDDNLPVRYGLHAGLPVYTTTVAPYDLVNTGGNYMSDGMGTAFGSNLVLRNNDQIANGEGFNTNDVFGTSDHTETSIDSVSARFMGVQRYIKLEELLYDGIHHIDMHMKLLDEETLLFGEYPAGVSDGPQIEANIQYILSNYKSAFGTDYKLVRIPMPAYNNAHPPFPMDEALYPTYANSVFVNKTLIMPSYSANPELNQAAVDTFQKYLPGYTIASVNCDDIIFSGGAVHCITREIGVRDPLRIVHQPLRNQNNDTIAIGYPIKSLVQHRSGVQSAVVHWTTNPASGIWNTVDMTSTINNYWETTLPIQVAGTKVSYYISAVANNGKTLARPLPAPASFWTFAVSQTSAVSDYAALSVAPIFPNPAAAITCIPVLIPQSGKGSLRLYNSLGQLVETIHDGDFPAGKSHWFTDARQHNAGVYFVECRIGGQQSVQKLLIR